MQMMNMHTEPMSAPTADTAAIGTPWDVDGVEYLIVQPRDLPDTTEAQVATLMAALECSELEAWHALRIIREDGEFVTSVTDDLDDLPLTAA